MVGIGAQDSLGQAQSFVASTGTTFSMLWSNSFDSWRHFDVASQPKLVLLDRSGRRAGNTMSRLDVGDLEERLDDLS